MLQGRVALVTGAARGIGRASAKILASHGAHVACIDLSESTETVNSINDNGGTSSAYVVDITSKQSVEDLVHQIHQDTSLHTSLLVNCAGITRDGFLWKLSEKDYDDVLSTNLKAPFLLTQAVAKNLIASRKLESGSRSNDVVVNVGSIVNISSIIGKTGNMGQSNYAAAKAGLLGLTKASAKDLAMHGIRVNAVLPGFINTPMAAAVPEKVLESVRQSIPFGYLGEPEDIAESVLYFCGRQSKYVTGSVLEVTGGLYM